MRRWRLDRGDPLEERLRRQTETACEAQGSAVLTDSLSMFGRTLVIAPHPDDEVLGAGGTIARLADEEQDVFVAVVTVGKPPAFTSELVGKVRSEAKLAHQRLGVRETFWLDQPAAELTETPTR